MVGEMVVVMLAFVVEDEDDEGDVGDEAKYTVSVVIRER